MIVNVFWTLKADLCIIQKAWSKCVAKNINLGPDLLQDQVITTSQLVEYFGTHPEFHEKVAAVLNSDPLADLGVETDKNDDEAPEITDDSEVLLTTVIKQSFGLDVALESDNNLGVAPSTSIILQDSCLTAGENSSKNLLFGTLNDGSELIGSELEAKSSSDSDSDSDFSEEEQTDREIDKMSEELGEAREVEKQMDGTTGVVTQEKISISHLLN